MNSLGWSNCRDTKSMIAHLSGVQDGRALRLFATGCCRRIWSLINDDRSRLAVECAESYADGSISVDELVSAYLQADSAASDAEDAFDTIRYHASLAASWSTAHPEYFDPAYLAGHSAYYAWQAANNDLELLSQESLLSDIIDIPNSIATGKVSWITHEVTSFAKDMYDTRQFEKMMLLGDLLEQAGCPDPRLIEHCRSEQIHTRGCWLIDLLLGRNRSAQEPCSA